MSLGDTLRTLLEAREMTQKQLAEHLNIGKSTLGNYIQNIREPDYDTLIKLADYFKVTTDFLLGYRMDQATGCLEKEQLCIFRSLNREQQEIYSKQGRVFIENNVKRKALASLTDADDDNMKE